MRRNSLRVKYHVPICLSVKYKSCFVPVTLLEWCQLHKDSDGFRSAKDAGERVDRKEKEKRGKRTGQRRNGGEEQRTSK